MTRFAQVNTAAAVFAAMVTATPVVAQLPSGGDSDCATIMHHQDGIAGWRDRERHRIDAVWRRNREIAVGDFHL